jgi:HEAT repeat protein
MIPFNKTMIKVFLPINIFFVLVTISTSTNANMLPIDPAEMLQERGYPTDTVEQVIEATRSESHFVRSMALQLLANRIGNKAAQTLKEALNYERIEVRCDAAHLLGSLGDKTGLERMRKDFEQLTSNDTAPVPLDPNVMDPEKIEEIEGKKNLRLYNALLVAKVLAELGDRRGYKLAARMASEGAWVLHKFEAIYVLVEVAKTDESILKVEGMDPISVLSAMARSEKNEYVFYLLTNMVSEKLRDDVAIRILEIAKDSPNRSEQARLTAQMHLNAVKNRKKADGNK